MIWLRRPLLAVQGGVLVVLALLAAICAWRSDSVDAPPECIDDCATGVAATHEAVIATFDARPTETPYPTITISAVGDVALGRGVVDQIRAHDPAFPFELVRPLLSGDIVVGNLEGPLTDRGEPWPKSYNFRTPPDLAGGLRQFFSLVSLANNHAMDYGAVGLKDTMSALNGYPSVVGAGDNGELAFGAVTVYACGGGRGNASCGSSAVRVAFLACVLTPDEGSGFSIHQWAATETEPGVAVCDVDRIRREVVLARPGSDFILFMMHAGHEYVHEPNATQREIAEAALAAGADVVLGSHAHVVQPVEQRGNKLIAWGLGNFVFDLDEVDLANIPEPRVSLVLQITLQRGLGVVAWRADPVVLDVNEDRPRPATTAEERAALERALQP